MTTLRTLIILSLASALFAWPVDAATYYVAQNDPKASDDNNGSEAAPFKTITRGAGALNSGDTLYVKKGVYREEVVLPRHDWNWIGLHYPAFKGSGKSYAEMTSIRAWSDDEVVIAGSDVVTDWKPFKDKVYVKENWTVNSQQAFCDGKVLQQIAGTLATFLMERWEGRKGDGLKDMVPGTFFYDIPGKKLYVWLADGGDPNKHTMEVSVRRFLFSLDADYVRVWGLKMRHATISATTNWGSAGVTGSNNIMENCEVAYADFVGLGVNGQCQTIIGCKSNYNGMQGIGGGGWGHRIINCETSHNNYRHFKTGWDGGGVKMIPYAHDVLVTGHLAAYNEGDGIWFDSGNFNVTIQNSVCHHNRGYGIFYEISERGTIRNNVCYENGGRGVFLSNSSDCQVLNNVFYRNGMSGVAAIGVNRAWAMYGEGKDHRVPARNNVIWGNIFYDNCNAEFCPKTPDGRDKPWDTRPELVMPEDWEGNTGNVSDYNIYYRSPGRVMPFWKGWHVTLFDDLVDWRKKTGWDAHSIIVEPKFVDASKYDFHPAKGSPAIDFVKPLMGAVYQMDGKPRPQTEHSDKADLRFTAGPFETPKEAK